MTCKPCSEGGDGDESILQWDRHMQRSCGRGEGGMFEELKESWGGWKVAGELGEQVQTTLSSGLRGPVKECSFCPKTEGF